MAYDPIFIANLVVTVGLVWMVLNHYEIVKYNPIDHATEEIQRLIHYNQLDGTVMPPPETLMTVPEIIVNRGYPLEKHTVVTEDGYVLELHRIPANNRSGRLPAGSQPKPVLLQHGIFATSFVWVTGANNNSLAYVLADNGYDVWLGNSRGNTYSRKHTTLSPEDNKYWDFSWDELGRYDLPATVDYILKTTNHKKLSYVGYSLGCAIFFIGANLKPDLNDKIEVMVGLAPTATVQKLDNAFKLIAPLNTPLKYIMGLTNTGLFLPNDGISSKLLRYICSSSQAGSAFCQVVNFYVFGYSESTNISMVHILTGHYPAGGSPKTMFQFFDNYNSGGNFSRYNYGETGNMERYGKTEAPKYQLELVTAPVYLVYGQTDGVASPQDVAWLADRLGNLKGSIRVDSPIFSHGDFFMSNRASELVYQPLIQLLRTLA